MFERVLSVVLTLAALIVAGALVTREVSDRRARLGPAGLSELHFQPEWE